MTGPFGPVGGALVSLCASTIESKDSKHCLGVAPSPAGLQSAIFLRLLAVHALFSCSHQAFQPRSVPLALDSRLESKSRIGARRTCTPTPCEVPLLSRQVRYFIDSDA